MNPGPSPKEIFNDALELPQSEWSEFLDRVCANKPALREQVEQLLAAHASAPQFLAAPTANAQATLPMSATPTPASAATAVAGDDQDQRIGPYKLLQLIGEGGFGSVYMAEQEQPVQRRVALKIIKLGMDTRQVIARFEAERQALAMMEHPNIARVFDAGATESGRPYFVMELVRGEPVIDYCDRHSLGIPQRLELFHAVCHAVQHAHQKGIIHRDIKPSNVLVTTTDGRPVPKVIDFGIAKATNARLTEKTFFTEHRQIIGTPEYMSPEQAEPTAGDIDTRTDVYSLGVLLYELLTGALPFDAKRLRSAAFAEIQRIICQEEPPRPSTRLSTLDSLPSVAARRQIEPARLSRLVRGDLDWIVMKCLEKDRSRRYETASELAQDVERHLRGEPVVAAPPSAAYRLRKLVRRHKVGVMAGAAVLAALMLGIIGTTVGMIRAEREARRAEREAERAQSAEAAAKLRAAELEQVVEFQASQLSGIETEMMGIRLRRDLLERRREALEARGSEDAEIGTNLRELEQALDGVNFTSVALEALDENIFARALAAINEQFADQPLVRARLLQTVADTLRDLGLLDKAMVPQEEALRIRRGEMGDNHPDTLTSINNMGTLLQRRGKLAEAEPFLREAFDGRRLALGDDHPQTLASINNMGSLLQAKGKLAEAETYYREVLDIRRRVLGDDHPHTLRSISNIGFLLQAQGRLTEAEAYWRDALDGHRRVLGDDHPHTLGSINNLGGLLQAQGKLAEAEPYWREALGGYRRVLGDEHPNTLTSINNLGILLFSQGKLAETAPYWREALEGRRRVLGTDHPSTLTSINNMGSLLKAQGRYADAEPYYGEVLETRRRVLGDDHPSTLTSINNMGSLLKAQGKYAEAEPYYRDALEGCRRVLGDDHPHTLIATSNLGKLLIEHGGFLEAEALLLPAAETAEARLPLPHPARGKLLEAISRLYDVLDKSEPNQGHSATAAQWRAKLVEWQATTQPATTQSATTQPEHAPERHE